MKVFKLILLAGFAVLPFAAAAHAADVDPPPVAEENDVTSFYLRGDLGWSFLEWSGGDDDSALSLGGGVGYQFNDNMRADMTADWAGDYDVAPGADMSTTTVLGNLYFDWANDSAFTPYVGAGLGYGWVDDAPRATTAALPMASPPVFPWASPTISISMSAIASAIS